jgi:hypothetical protein
MVVAPRSKVEKANRRDARTDDAGRREGAVPSIAHCSAPIAHRNCLGACFAYTLVRNEYHDGLANERGVLA